MKAAEPFITPTGSFVWITPDKALPILVDHQEDKGILRAIANLQKDAAKVTGITPELIKQPTKSDMLIIGSIENNKWIKELMKSGKINAKELTDKHEKYIMTTVNNPFPNVDRAVVIAGSVKRGTI